MASGRSIGGFLGQQGVGDSLNQFLGGLFGNSGAPFEKGAGEYQKWLQQGVGAYNPYYNAGVGAIGNYQNALNRMQDPSSFLNNLISQYRQSPYTSYLQQQGQRGINNAASASGLLGSTPYQQQGIQMNQQIAQQGLNDWLSQVLGINSQYLGGEGNLMNQGFNAAQGIGNLYGNAADWLGKAQAGKTYGENLDRSNLWQGGIGLAGEGASYLGL